MKFTTSSLLALLPIVSAHFEILSPTPRPQNENTADNFPCGGANDVSATRAAFNPNGGTVSSMFSPFRRHSKSLVETYSSTHISLNCSIAYPTLYEIHNH
jgi:hypothetical protein